MNIEDSKLTPQDVKVMAATYWLKKYKSSEFLKLGLEIIDLEAFGLEVQQCLLDNLKFYGVY